MSDRARGLCRLVAISLLFLLGANLPLFPSLLQGRVQDLVVIYAVLFSGAAWWGSSFVLGKSSKPLRPPWLTIAIPGALNSLFVGVCVILFQASPAPERRAGVDLSARFEREKAAVENVEMPASFEGWAAHRAGSWVRFRAVVEETGLLLEVDFTQTLVEISGERGVVEYERRCRMSNGASSEAHGRAEIFRRDAPVRDDRTGDEEIEVAERRLRCRWGEGSGIKTWRSGDIPGGVARRESTASVRSPCVRTVAVAWQSK